MIDVRGVKSASRQKTKNSWRCVFVSAAQVREVLQENPLDYDELVSGRNVLHYVYVNGQLLARIDNSVVYYYHVDHLGTPQMMTDAMRKVVWRGDYEPFGKVSVKVQGVVNNVRYQGQYQDQETGLYYNYFRDYDPSTGRYVQSDPIGLAGGINTFGYVESNPINLIDPLGLMGNASGASQSKSGPIAKQQKPLDCDDPCIEVTTRGVCDGNDFMCPMAMQAAGISGPYYGSTRRYNWKCLLTLGVGGKVGGAAAGNYAASKAPNAAKAMGAGASTMNWVTRGAVAWTNPYFTGVMVTAGLVAVEEKCSCDK